MVGTLMEKNYSENHYLKLLQTIVTIHQCQTGGLLGGNIEINGPKLLKSSNYSPMLNYRCRKGSVYLK